MQFECKTEPPNKRDEAHNNEEDNKIKHERKHNNNVNRGGHETTVKHFVVDVYIYKSMKLC